MTKNADAVRRRLEARRKEMREDIERELRKYKEEHYSHLADRVADSGEKSVANLLSDVNLAEVTRDVAEIRDIELALSRLDEGRYGICVECGERIDEQRLDARPESVRCVDCKAAIELRSGDVGSKSL